MDAPERRRALAGGRVPEPVRWAGAGLTLAVLLGVSSFVASLTDFHSPGTHLPLLIVSVLIAAVGIGAARRIVDRRPASPWLAAAVIVPALVALYDVL
ncbi:MAG TPA: hypothetical protein VGL93_20920 [Streptosporangiaceae bacterium]|jgi:hypothetical protein